MIQYLHTYHILRCAGLITKTITQLRSYRHDEKNWFPKMAIGGTRRQIYRNLVRVITKWTNMVRGDKNTPRFKLVSRCAEQKQMVKYRYKMTFEHLLFVPSIYVIGTNSLVPAET